jgi:hypothetical protein
MLVRRFFRPGEDPVMVLEIAGRFFAEHRVTNGGMNSESLSGGLASDEDARKWMIGRMSELRGDGWCETARSISRKECLWFEGDRPLRCWAGEIAVFGPDERTPDGMPPWDGSMLLHGDAEYGVRHMTMFTTRFGTPEYARQGLKNLFEERVQAGWRPVHHEALSWYDPK